MSFGRGRFALTLFQAVRWKNLIKTWHQHWLFGFLLLALLLVLVGTVSLARDLGHPFGGAWTSYMISDDVYRVRVDTPGWWSGLKQGNLQYQDDLLEINGRPYDNRNERSTFATAFEPGESSVEIVVKRQDNRTVLSVPVVTFTWMHLLEAQLPHLLFGFSFFLIALAVYLADPVDPLHRITVCLVGVLTLFGLERVSLFWPDNGLAQFLNLVDKTRGTFLGVLFIHFGLHYPYPSRLLKRPILILLYVAASYVVLGRVLARLLVWNNGSLDWASWLYSQGKDYWLFILIGIGFVMFRLTKLWLQGRLTRRQRHEIRIFVIVLLIPLPLIFFQATAGLFGFSSVWFWGYLDLRYLALAIPTGMAAFMLRYQTFQQLSLHLLMIPLITISALMASIGVAIVPLIQPELNLNHIMPLFLLIFILTFMVSILWYTQSSWSGWFGRLLHWEKTSYTAVKRFVDSIIVHRDAAELPAYIVQALCAELALGQAAIWRWQKEDRSLHLASKAGAWPSAPPTVLNVPYEQPFSSTKPLRLNVSNDVGPDWLRPLHQLPFIKVVAPLLVADQPVGLLAIGKRWDEALFDDRDLEIIELIGQQSALSLLTAHQIDQLRQVPHQITQAQERERYKISGELHDTIQQFLGRLPFYLEASRGLLETDPQEADALLQHSIDDIANAAQTVRRIRTNLAPTQLDNGFMHAVSGLVEKFRFDTGLAITFEGSSDLDPVISPEARHALYRVVQQALDNVRDHAQARHVTVSFKREKNRIIFCIADDGVGSSAKRRANAQAKGSFGLLSMKYRISSVGGAIEFCSEANKGTQVKGWVPATISD